MATLTAQGVTDALQSVCGSPAAQGTEGAPQFRRELNLALPRLYNMGMWRDLVFEDVVTTTSSTFTIPDNAESIISAIADGDGSSTDYSFPRTIRSQFHDYRLFGRDDTAGEHTLAALGIVDDGYSATVEEPVAGKTYQLTLSPISPESTLPDSGDIFITFSDGSVTSDVGDLYDHVTNNGGKFVCGGQASISSAKTTVVSISEIRVGTSDLSAPVRLTWEETGSSTSLVAANNLQQANQITRYRRYRIDNRDDKTVTLRLLLKRKFEKLLSSTDVVYVSSLNAIKHAMLGNIAEDNADVERANYHWAVCRALLDEQLDAHRGAAKPAVNFSPAGAGGSTINIM